MKVLHVFTIALTAETFFDGQFHFLSENGQNISLVCSESPTIQSFADRNKIKYIPMEIERTISPLKDLTTLRKLIKFIKQEKFDIIVGHTPKGALLSMLAARIAGCPRRVYLRHGLIYTTATGIKRRVLLTEEKFVSSLATDIINVSPSLGEVAIHDKLNKPEKQHIIGNGTCGGIDTISTFNPRKINENMLEALRGSQKIEPGDFVIGFCGRLCKDKGIPELIDGFQLFQKRNPHISTKLLLVGGYDSRDVLPEEIHHTIHSNPHIIHTGHIIKNIQNYYALMDVFVFPSHREGFGMCSIEAQAMGKPSLVARSHGCIDTIIEGKTGLYIDLTQESISDKLTEIYNQNSNNTFGIAARNFVCHNFERTKLWPLILNFYNNL